MPFLASGKHYQCKIRTVKNKQKFNGVLFLYPIENFSKNNTVHMKVN